MRLNKYIASSGICSRRAADELIANGKVKVNKIKITTMGLNIIDGDEVEVNGKKIILEEKKVYIMLNKPKGYITTSSEQFNRPCIMDLIHENIRVFPVGRLDMDTEGVILLTNDGQFTNNVIHPRNKIEKRYIVEVHEDINKKQIEMLKDGVDIGDYITKEAKVRLLDEKHLEIIIAEGKNRQIRRMCENVGIIVYNLKRVAIGKLTLGDLKVGEYVKLDSKSIEKVFK